MLSNSMSFNVMLLYNNKKAWIWGTGSILMILFFCLCWSALAMQISSLFNKATNNGYSYSLTIINDTEETICSIRLAESSSHPIFGYNKLGRKPLDPDDSTIISNISSGYYDMKGKTCEGKIVWDYDIPVLGNNAQWTITNKSVRD